MPIDSNRGNYCEFFRFANSYCRQPKLSRIGRSPPVPSIFLLPFFSLLNPLNCGRNEEDKKSRTRDIGSEKGLRPAVTASESVLTSLPFGQFSHVRDFARIFFFLGFYFLFFHFLFFYAGREPKARTNIQRESRGSR